MLVRLLPEFEGKLIKFDSKNNKETHVVLTLAKIPDGYFFKVFNLIKGKIESKTSFSKPKFDDQKFFLEENGKFILKRTF